MGAVQETQESSWMNPIRNFLTTGELPRDKQEAQKVALRAKRFVLQDGVLYKQSFTHPLLRCLSQFEADEVLREVHSGVCGNHMGVRTLAHQILQ